MNADRGLTVFCGLIGIYWTFTGLFEYGMWINNGPGPGFLPVCLGVSTCIIALLLLLKQLKQESAPFDKRALLPIGAMILFTIGVYLVGFFISIFIFLIAWPVIRGGYSLKYSLIFSAALTAAIWGIFSYWLQVPFPTSLIGI